MLRVCVVGSGPGGMYAAKYLLKNKALADRLRIDVVEKLPVCYGLVRFGVAPDHPEVKSVSNDFDQVMGDHRVRLVGNVDVGTDVSVQTLRDNYDAVLLAYGASKDRMMGLQGESEIPNIWGAREFVNWYNGHPEMIDRNPPNLECESAAIVGQGNVALDIARVLTKDVDELAKTDISASALEALSQSKIRHVSVIGRRGSAQAAFTIKEMRELTKLGNHVICSIRPDEFKLGLTEASQQEIKDARAKTRIHKLLKEVVSGYDKDRVFSGEFKKVIDLRFLLSPTAILTNPETGALSGLTVTRNELVGSAGKQNAKDAGQPPEIIDCGLLVRSIGYQSEPLEGVPFDPKSNTAANSLGRCTGAPGLYASGWLKRGPSGIIGTNINDSRETVECMVQDLEALGEETKESTGKYKAIEELLDSSKRSQLVDWSGYEKIDKEETRRGEASTPPRPRLKMLDAKEMLSVIHR